MPELPAYESELLHGIYRGNFYDNETPAYHRHPR